MRHSWCVLSLSIFALGAIYAPPFRVLAGPAAARAPSAAVSPAGGGGEAGTAMQGAVQGVLFPLESNSPASGGLELQNSVGARGGFDFHPVHSSWRSTLGFAVLFLLAVAGLTFAEWRWLVARQRHLRTLVKERTQELEQEKAELIRAKAALVELAARDSLTGLFNRGAIFEILEQEVKRARRERCSFAVVLTDLDNFKRVNDTYGHLTGDEVLREFARRIHKNLRPYDRVGRFGGEELLVLMPGMRDESAARIRELHQQVTQEPFVIGELVLRVTCSFGIAWFPAPLNTVESLVSLADQALYAAKANGRNRVEVGERLSLIRPANFGEWTPLLPA